MKKIAPNFLFVFIILGCTIAMSQELNCFDGIDNDGDGTADVAGNNTTILIGDTDCSCFLFTTVGTSDLTITPPVGTTTNTTSTYCFDITSDIPSQAGAIWLNSFVDLDLEFNFSAELYAGDSDSGADGFTITFQKALTGFSTLGSLGGQLGMGTVEPSVFLEVDTYINGFPTGDNGIFNDHLAVNIDGFINPADNRVGTPSFVPLPNIEDNEYHNLTINWNPTTNTLTYVFDGQTMTYTNDLVANIFGGDNEVIFGFTGATGASFNRQVVCITSINTGDPGISNTLHICDDGSQQTFNLFDQLGGTPTTNGTWEDPSGSPFGTDHLGLFDSTLDLPGTYTYTIPGALVGCPSGTSTIEVVFNDPPTADAPADVTICDSYTLPALSQDNNYFTQTNGGGTQLNAGDIITTTQTIFVFAQTGTTPNCTDENSFTVTINNAPNSGTLSATPSEFCIGDTTIATTDGDTGGTWTSSDTVVATVDINGIVTALSSGTTNIKYTIDTNGCEASSFITISVFAPIEVNATNAELCILDDALDLFTILSGNITGEGEWVLTSNNDVIENGLFDPILYGLGVFELQYFEPTENCSVDVDVTLSILVNDDCLPCTTQNDISVSKTVTRNNDGVNDFLLITGMVEECEYTLNLKVYNRWGAAVYKSANYKNDWDGSAPTNAIGNATSIPTGSYFYVLYFLGENSFTISGTVYIGTN